MRETTGNPWEHWDKKVRDFKKAKKLNPPETTIRDWQRNLIFFFMEELSRNILDENVSLDSIIDKIIEAIQIGYGFRRVRLYHAHYYDRNYMMLYLFKKSKGHGPIPLNVDPKLRIREGADASVDTLFTKDPIAVNDAKSLKLKYKKKLKISGPYVAIPLFIDGSPYGLICADSVSKTGADDKTKSTGHFAYKERFNIFAHSIIAAIESRNMFEQRNQRDRQFELVKEIYEQIHTATEKEKFYHLFLKFCVEEVGADGGHLKLYNKNSKRLEKVAECGDDLSPQKVKHKPRAIGFSNLVFRNRTALLINDLKGNPLMKKSIAYYKSRGYEEHLQNLKNRKSALIAPILEPTGSIRGVIDLHSRSKNHFTEFSKRNLLALAGNFIYFLDTLYRFEEQEELLKQKETLLKEQTEMLETRAMYREMLEMVIEKSHDLPSVLEKIVTTCERIVKAPTIVNLTVNAPYLRISATEEGLFLSRVPPDNVIPITTTEIDAIALKYGRIEKRKDEIAFPIFIEGESEGVLYIGALQELALNSNEVKLLEIISKTTGALVTVARNIGRKIKQSSTLYDLTQQSKKTQNFSDWFNPVMDKVMDIIGGKNRYFYLAMVEKFKGKEIIKVRADSRIPKDSLIGDEIPIDKSLSGVVVEEKVRKYIPDVVKNEAKNGNGPTKVKNYRQDPNIMSVVGIPLLITEGNKERAIGVLLIDSEEIDDFKDLDWEFLETTANYFATIIYNQQLSDERAQMQAELSRKDTAAEVDIILNNFFHDIKDPLQEIRCAFNILGLSDDEKETRESLEHAKELSDQMLSITDMYSSNFAKTAGEQKTAEVRKLINDSLDTIAMTTGLPITVQREYEDFDSKINCNPVSIQMAFRSIIDNAIKYSKKLDEKERYLKIDVEHDTDDSLSITFASSTYKAIPEDKLKKIFDPFNRATTEGSGKGLGLSLAGLCVNLHRGQITADNLEPKNNVIAVQFKVTLPKGFGTLSGENE